VPSACGSIEPARIRFSVPVHTLLLLAGILSVATGLVAFAVDSVVNRNPIVLAGIGLNLVIASAALAGSVARDTLSLTVIFWYYSFLFLTVAPLTQYLTGRWLFPVSEELIIYANLLVLLSFLCFLPGNALGRSSVRAATAPDPAVRGKLLPDSTLNMLAGAALAFVAVTIAAGGGFRVSESPVLRLFGGSFTPISMMAEFVLRPLVFFVFLIAVLRWRWGRRTPSATAGLLISAAAAVLMLGPLSGARFFVFAMYLGLTLIVLPPSNRTRYVYIALLFCGIFGSHVQNVLQDLASERAAGAIAFTPAYFYEGHFDGFENLCHAISFVASEGIAWGEQLLGAVLFWMPREWWPTKPIGSGTYIASTYLANYYQVSHVNVAAPLVQEAFLNFHLPGVIFVFFVLGYAAGWVDVRVRALTQSRYAMGRVSFHVPGRGMAYVVLYPVLVGLLLFVLRGDLLSSTAFTTGILVAYAVLSTMIRLLSRNLADHRARPA
jgi:hypothetical protein